MLGLGLDGNRFLETQARCLNQKETLNSPGRLITVLSFFHFFSILHMVFLQQFHVYDFRFQVFMEKMQFGYGLLSNFSCMPE